MEGLLPPQPIKVSEENMAQEWRIWKQEFQLYEMASTLKDQKDDCKIATFLHAIGRLVREIYNSFNLPGTAGLSDIMAEFDAHFLPKKNLTMERHKFFTRVQMIDEPFDSFLTDIKIKSATCEFEQLEESLVRDKIVCGITNDNVRIALLQDPDLKLDKAIQICKSSELVKSRIKELKGDNKQESNIDMITGKQKSDKNRMNPNKINRGYIERQRYNEKKENPAEEETYPEGNSTTHMERQEKSGYRQKSQYTCNNCYLTHDKWKCPAFTSECFKCKKRGHFARCCKSKIATVYQEQESYDSDDELVNLGSIRLAQSIDQIKVTQNEWFETIQISRQPKIRLQCKLDTGAQVNVIPENIFKKLSIPIRLKPSNKKLTNYTGIKIEVLGQIELECITDNDNKKNIEFQIVKTIDDRAQAILGCVACQQLGLISRIGSIEIATKNIIKEFKDVFEGIGCIKEEQEIIIDPTIPAKIHAARKVPLALLDSLKKELDDLEQSEIIVKVQEPTEWVNSMTVVRKPNGGLRICLDPQDLNKAIKREHCYLPTVEDITNKLAGAKVFSTLDASKGFFQIKLTEKSSKLTCFNTPFGRYRYLRLPFGIKSASEIFHKQFTQVFEGLEGVTTYCDDIIVWGKSQKEHDNRLREVLQRIRSRNVKLNKEKCKIGETKIQFLGHTLSEEGLRWDTDKIKPIIEMPIPQDRKAVERFLGMVTYVSKFIPNLSQRTVNLRDLLKQDIVFQWQTPQMEEFKELKQMLSTQPVLQYFDGTKPITISVDASKDGVGAVLLQNGLPVIYASKALIESQKNWAQIEKETYAILFGCERMHQYIYGRKDPFTIETDHKPLEAIFRKPLVDCPLRLQRMRIRLQMYDFNLHYVKGKELYIADTLSRAYLEDTTKETSEMLTLKEIEAQVALIQANIRMSCDRNQEIKQEIQKDEVLKILVSIIKSGWPLSKDKLPEEIKPYWKYRDDLIIYDDLIYKGKQILIPWSLRKDILYRIHYNHQGIEKCKERARQSVFWVNMNQHITDTIENCATCERFKRSQQKETLMPHPIPPRPWHTIALDIFHLRGANYLLCVDYYSKYIEVIKLESMKSDTIINSLKQIFATHGIPEKTMSDNGTQFDSRIFRQFAKEWNFSACTSSPGYPQSNGMVERHVGTIKKILKKAMYDDRDINLCLLEYRNTPIDNNLGSPAQLLMGRNIKGLLPQTEIQLKEYEPKTDTKRCLENKQRTQTVYYNRGAKDLRNLYPNDKIYVQDKDKKIWNPATIIKKCERPRSYLVKMDTGRLLERNRRFIRKVKEAETTETIVKEEEESDTKGKDTGNKTETKTNIKVEEESDINEWTKKIHERKIKNEPPIMTKYGRISKKPNRYIEEC